VSAQAVLFIDANQYLDLYRMFRGKQLLAALVEQKDYIFVTSQVVDEVSRNKVKVAASFLANAIKKMELNTMTVPDHMLADDRVQSLGKRLQKTGEELTKTRDEFGKLTQELLEQVSQSNDEVSKALSVIFSKAVAPNAQELERAKQRKVHGNPPGKDNDPLGDQLSWEQILTKCKEKPRLWVITKDSDYATEHGGKLFLNALLHQDLASLCEKQPEVFCFHNIVDGLKHFSATTSVKAKKLPPPNVTEQIKKEQESLPPLDWLFGSNEMFSTAIRNTDMSRALAALAAQPHFAPLIDMSEIAKSMADLRPFIDMSEIAKSIANLRPFVDMSEIAKSMADLRPFVDTFEIAKSIANLRPFIDTSELAKAIRGPSTKETVVSSSADTSTPTPGSVTEKKADNEKLG